ncbi:uncharacterized protein LOC142535419 [Primulina tabacum]|uniref:uncharacterized protein LOC142535419 n=1 Tax=Primulina tabacum TaxID=48773 RepID=UPI003F59F1DE
MKVMIEQWKNPNVRRLKVCFVLISCYFSKRTSLGDLQDFLYLRQNVLPAVLAILNLKDFCHCSMLLSLWRNWPRIKEIPRFFSKLGESLLGYLNHAISIVEKYYNDGLSGCLEWNSIIINIDSTATSFKSFTSSPFLSNCQEKNIASSGFYFEIVQSSERLLKALAKLYERCSECRRNSQAKPDFLDLSDTHSIVSIVNHTLSLASSSSDCPLPFFSKDTIACTIQTIVDGFLDRFNLLEEHSKVSNLLTRLTSSDWTKSLLRLIIGINATIWPALRCSSICCNHLAGTEVLVNLLGHRAVIPSTFK